MTELSFDPTSNLWIPSGTESKEIRLAVNEVEAYDPRLTLAKHEITGDWVIFTKLDNGALYPVIGLGKDLPSPDYLRQRILNADTRRQGEQMLYHINKKNEEIRKQNERPVRDGIGKTAEALEWGYRKLGKHPVNRVFVPRGI